LENLERLDVLTTLQLRMPLTAISSAIVDIREMSINFTVNELAKQTMVVRVREMKVRSASYLLKIILDAPLRHRIS